MTPSKHPANPPGQDRPPIVTGGMTVEITIGEVSIVIEGPVPKVLAVLNWLFGTAKPESVIASLKLAFGPEVTVKTT